MALARHHVEALEEYLRGQLTADEVTISGVQRLTGGAIQDNLGLELEIHHPQDSTLAGHQRWVLRSNAPTQLAMSLSRAQEYAVLQAAHGAGVKVPRPLGYCADAAVIGRPFYLMERLPGTARGAAVVAMGSEELAAELGAQLARLHRITPGSPGTAGLDFLPLPAGDPAAARLAAYRQYLDALPHPHPVLEYSLAWLERHLPRGGEVALCHVDYRTGNYLVDNGQLQGILDWEFAAWSQPLEDLGWFCAPCWRFG
ncbi:MAG: phosphotransferase family protein, partial [Candidatus Competibacterales bacterium]